MDEVDITRLLIAWSDGDETALGELMPLLYDELSRLAVNYLRSERPDHTLQTAALVHEAYLRLIDQQRVQWRNRAHFVGIAAKLMRRILVDHARHHGAVKRGSDFERISLDLAGSVTVEPAAELVALDDALSDLAQTDEELAAIVELRYFGGLSIEEIAETRNISTATVNRKWRLARAWLFRCIQGEEHGP